LLRRSGRLEEAEALYREVETAIGTEFGPKHPELVTVLDHLGTFYMERARFAEAAEVLKRGYVLAEERLTRDHPDRAQVLNNLGRAMLNLGEFEAAWESFGEAAKILDWKFGKGHKDYATVRANGAVALFSMGRLDEAIGQCTEALHLREAALGLSHPDVAESLATLGALHHQRDELDHAEKLLARAQRIYEMIAPGHSAAFSQLLFNQASLYLDSMEPVLAAKSTEQALSLALPIFGEDHPTIVQFLETLGVAQALSGDRETSQQTLARAAATAESIWDERHSVAQRIRALEVQVAKINDSVD
jgi:tetratricopeptide (TPR) repeat protein